MAGRLVKGRTWSTPAQLELETIQYQRKWWQADPDVAAEATKNPVLAALLATDPMALTTADVYRDDAGRWPSRSALHDRLVAAQLGAGVPPKPPTVFFTTGPIGAGKTRVLRPLVHAYRTVTGGLDPSSLSRIAADEVRMALPEYEQGLGHLVVQAEAFAVTYGPVYSAARSARLDIVYDTIGTVPASGTPTYEPYLRELKADGFAIHLLLVQTPLLICMQRAEHRALTEDGRLVTPQFQADIFDQPRQVFERLRAELGLLDGWVLVDGSGPADSPPMIEGSDLWVKRYADILDAVDAQAAS